MREEGSDVLNPYWPIHFRKIVGPDLPEKKVKVN
jgi:hypothetical protein